MEHRCSERVDIDLRAAVYKRGLAVATGRIRNSSKQGLFLETRYCDVNLLQKLSIEVIVHPAPQQSERYEVQAIVVRKSVDGLGLELESIGGEDTFAMTQLMNAVGAMSYQPVAKARMNAL